MKITDYGPCIRGHFASKYKNLPLSRFCELKDLKLSYHSTTNIFLYIHMEKLLYLEFFSKGAKVRLYGQNQPRPIMSFTTKMPMGGKASGLFEKVVAAIEAESENRVRNLSEIRESTALLKKIGAHVY